MGRTPKFTQTDFGITHRYRFGADSRFTLVGEVTLLNLWDEENVLTLQNVLTNGAISLTNTCSGGVVTVPAAFPQFVVGGPCVGQSVNYPGLINAYNKGELLPQINTYLAGHSDDSELARWLPMDNLIVSRAFVGLTLVSVFSSS